MVKTLRKLVLPLAIAIVWMAIPATPGSVASAAGRTPVVGQHWTPEAGIGDKCIVGTWKNQAGDGGKVTWNGHHVKMHGGAGAVERDWASGRTVTSYRGSDPYTGKTGGHTLKMILRGKAEGVVHFNKESGRMRYEGTKTKHYRLTFVYKGKRSRGSVGPIPWYQKGRYTCGPSHYTTSSGKSDRVSGSP